MRLIDAMNMMRRLEALPEIYRAADKLVITTMHQYFSDLYKIEVRDKSAFENNQDIGGYEKSSIAEKIEIHKKYWCNPALFYTPCSITSHPEHNWDLLKNIEIFRNEDDENQMFIFSAKYPYPSGGLSNRVYVLRLIDGQLKIEHQFM